MGVQLAVEVGFWTKSACIWGRFESVWASDHHQCLHRERYEIVFGILNNIIGTNDTPMHASNTHKHALYTRIHTQNTHVYGLAYIERTPYLSRFVKYFPMYGLLRPSHRLYRCVHNVMTQNAYMVCTRFVHGCVRQNTNVHGVCALHTLCTRALDVLS